MEVSPKSVARSSVDGRTKAAWSSYVRKRWPENAVSKTQTTWDLTEGEAKGLVYGQGSQSTIDKVLEHPRGGFAVGLEILTMVTAIKLEDFISQQAEEARRERIQWEARERRLSALSVGLSQPDSRAG